MVGGRADFFISHAGADRAWAEWVAWQLTDAGYTVELDVWDWAAGQNFVMAMSDALERCDRVVALFSAAYFDRSRYTTKEWAAAALHVPDVDGGRLVPVRVEEIPAAQVPGVLRALVFRDLFGVAEEQARQILLEAVAGPRRPDDKPVFPGRGRQGDLSRLGASGPRLPGTMPRVWNIPARNPGFTGRDGLLMAVRERLLAGDRAVVQALEGMGGVGKTQLAAEYAHLFAGAYDLAWWIDSERAGLIGDQFAALGAALGCVPAGAASEAVRMAVLAELRGRGRWLLVFDNAETPADISGWLPGGGHVLITSRERGWAEIAESVEVDVLARPESVAILQDRVMGLGEPDADRLADQLGDLPLAIAQAAGFMAETGMAAAQYLDLLRTRAGPVLGQPLRGSYRRSLAAVTQLIADRLAGEDPVAADLASMCAFLAPEPIPEYLFTDAVSEMPGELAARLADPLAWRQTLARLTRQSLARIDRRGLQMHRLTQAMLRDRLTPDQAIATRAFIEAMLVTSAPRGSEDLATWPRWSQLMPHLLAAELATTDNPDLRTVARDACWYLIARGDIGTANKLAGDLHQWWSDRLGDDHEDTRTVTLYLIWTLRDMGRYADARELAQDGLDRCRRVLGEDHPESLRFACQLAGSLRDVDELQAARDLYQETFDRSRQTLGEDHPDTLRIATDVASNLSALGEVQAACDLAQDTLDRQRLVLGEDHLDTLRTATNMINYLYHVSEVQAACDLAQDTLDHYRRTLGENHPETMFSMGNMAFCLHGLGEVQAARDLYQETLDRQRRILGEGHPDTLSSERGLDACLRELGEADDDPDAASDITGITPTR